jgi:hypothetical protein
MRDEQKTPTPQKPRRLIRKIMLSLLTLAVLGSVLAAASLAYLMPKTWKAHTGRNAFPVRQKDGSTAMMAWEEPVALPAPINAHPDEVVSASMSADAKTLVIARRPKGGKADLFVSQLDHGTWSPPKPIITINSDEYDEIEPFITLDGKHLLYSSDRPDGMGGYDIWVAPLTADGWGVPMNLGPKINSEFNERSPAMNVDKDKLYLSSDRPTSEVGETERRQFWERLERREAAGNHEIFVCDDVDLSKDANPLRDRKLREMIIAKLGGSKETEAAVKKALTWYAAKQEPDGRWDSAKNGGMPGQDIAATGFATLCFYGWGERHDKPGEYQDTLARAVEWLANESVRRKGNFASGVSQGMYGQGVATIALAEAYGITGDKRLEGPLTLAVQVILKAQQPDLGGWRYNPVPHDADTSVLGWQVMALYSARKAGINVPQAAFDLAGKWLDSAGSGEHGGLYGYQVKTAPTPPMTAEAMFIRQLLGAKPSEPRQQESADFLVSQEGVDRKGKKGKHSNLPGPQAASNYYHWYYGALSMYQHQGDDWKTWNEALRPLLLARQNAAGDQAGVWIGGQWKQAGPLVTTAMATLALEVYYRYLPIYQLDQPGADAFRKSGEVIPGLELKPRPMRAAARQLLKIPLLARHVQALSSTGDEFGLTFSPDGDYVYFASNRLGGSGGYDLYRSRIVHYSPGGGAEAITTHVIQVPENAADPLNTLADESSASLAGDGLTMVFISNRSPDNAAAANVYVTTLTPISPVQAALAFLNSIKWWLIGLICGLIALIALILWWRNAENREQVSLLVKCLIGSAGLHAAVLVLLSLWMIGQAMVLAKGDPMEIAIDADALASEKLSEAIREQVTEMETTPEPIHVASDRAPMPMPTIDPVEIAPRAVAPAALAAQPGPVKVEATELAVAEPQALPRPDVRQVQLVEFAADVELELKPQETPQENQAAQAKPDVAFALASAEPKMTRPADEAMRQAPKVPRAAANVVDVLIETDEVAPAEARPKVVGLGDIITKRIPRVTIGDSVILEVPENAGSNYVLRQKENRDRVLKRLGGSDETEAAIGRALDWFTAHQESDGRWSGKNNSGEDGHDNAMTGFAMLCYFGWGAKHTEAGPYQAPMAKAVNWLASQIGSDGDLTGGGGQGMYDQGIATMALAEAYGLTKDPALFEPLRRATAFITRAQSKTHGGWRYRPNSNDGDTSVVGWQVMALTSARMAGLRVPEESFDLARKWFDGIGAGPHRGLYGYTGANPTHTMTAEGMFCQQLMGLRPENPRMIEAAEYLKTAVPDPRRPGYYYWYYGCLSLYQHQGPIWEMWNQEMKKSLLSMQVRNGSSAGAWPASGQWTQRGGLVMSTAMATLSLEVYYRYLPMYHAIPPAGPTTLPATKPAP